MGQTSCCCEQKEEDRIMNLQTFTPGGSADSVVLSRRVEGKGAGETSFWEELKGVYVRQSDLKHMATIQGNRLHWAEAFRADPCEVSLCGPRQVAISLGGQVHTAEVGARAESLLWDDGEVWTKQ
mmetsp:Transcript_66748/g.157179  ORF Transcript_66748/g.157179 Transcript_66748/m.157179 type:complete len:125 (+) Transcript_66748:47-421(+)